MKHNLNTKVIVSVQRNSAYMSQMAFFEEV